MKIAVITRWFNEEFFAPFFLSHYSEFADKIIVFLEQTSTDRSREIVPTFPKAELVMVSNGETLNDRILSDMMSNAAASLADYDWVIRADADELTFPYNFESPREVLSRATGNVINTWYRWVYRHNSESDLDPSKPAVFQRRHGGEYRIWPGMGQNYSKPTIVKPSAKVRWTAGEQSILPNPLVKMNSESWDGVHWQTADVEQWIKRNASNDKRLSEENKKNKWGVKNFTEEMIRKECDSHLNDLQLF